MRIVFQQLIEIFTNLPPLERKYFPRVPVKLRYEREDWTPNICKSSCDLVHEFCCSFSTVTYVATFYFTYWIIQYSTDSSSALHRFAEIFLMMELIKKLKRSVGGTARKWRFLFRETSPPMLSSSWNFRLIRLVSGTYLYKSFDSASCCLILSLIIDFATLFYLKFELQ